MEGSSERVARQPGWQWLVVAALLGALVLQATGAATRNSVTFDEHAYIAAGHSYWARRDFRLGREHPPLTKLVAGLPLVGMDLGSEEADRIFDSLPETGTGMGQFEYGEEFLFGRNLERLPEIVFRARAAMLVFPLLLGLCVYLWSRELFGIAGGIVSLALLATNPDVLGHGALATNDVPMATFYLSGVYAAWRYLRRPSPASFLGIALSVGLVLSCKFTGLLLLPVLGLIGLLALLDPAMVTDRPAALGAPLGHGPLASRVLWCGANVLGVILVATGIVWASYLFVEPVTAYWDGLQLTYTLVRSSVPSFLFGEYRLGGVWYYYPAALLFKLPLGLQALLLISLWRLWQERKRLLSPRSRLRFQVLCFLVPVVTLLVVVTWRSKQIGHRYVFGAYGFFFVAAGCAGPLLVRAIGEVRARGLRARLPLLTAVVLLALVLHAASAGLRGHPFYISFANPLAGSPKRFVDMFEASTVDWQHGWKEVARLQEEGRLGDVAVLYDPRLPRSRSAYGIRHVRYRISMDVPPPGTYLFSSNDYARIRRSRRSRGAHVPILEDFDYDVIAGSILAVRVDERLPSLPEPLRLERETLRDDQGRRRWERQVHVAPDGVKTPHGPYTRYFKDGGRESGTYRMGKVHGRYERFRADGTLTESGSTWLGKLHGEVTRFDERGRPIRTWTFFNDARVSS